MEAPKPKVVREKMGRNSWLDTSVLHADLLADADEFTEIWNLHPESAGMILFMGKLIPVPRYQQSYLRDYKFSGVESKSIPLPEILQPYLRWANALGYGEFNQFLVNWYENGGSYIGSHSDDEKQLLPDSPIMTITLCQPSEADKKGKTAKPTLRKFRIRDKDKKIVKDIETANGAVLVMGGTFQKEFKHEIVKIAGKKADEVGPRISITLRQFKPEKEKKIVLDEKEEKHFFSECILCQVNTKMVHPESGQFICSLSCFHECVSK